MLKLYTKDVLSALKTPEEERFDLEKRIRDAMAEYGRVPDLAVMAYSYFHVPYFWFSEIIDKINEEERKNEEEYDC